MSPLAIAIVATVQANGAPMAWDAVVASVEPSQRNRVMNAVREAVREGQLKRNLAHDSETGVTPLTISFVGGA